MEAFSLEGDKALFCFQDKIVMRTEENESLVIHAIGEEVKAKRAQKEKLRDSITAASLNASQSLLLFSTLSSLNILNVGTGEVTHHILIPPVNRISKVCFVGDGGKFFVSSSDSSDRLLLWSTVKTKKPIA